MPSIGRNPALMPYGPGQADYEYDGKVGRDMDFTQHMKDLTMSHAASRSAS